MAAAPMLPRSPLARRWLNCLLALGLALAPMVSTHAAPAKKATTSATKKAPATKTAAAKAPRKPAAGKAPSAALAAVIGSEPVARPEAVKKLWEYIKAHNLQDPKDKRTIVADDKLRAVFGKDSAGMFELAGLLGNHLGGE